MKNPRLIVGAKLVHWRTQYVYRTREGDRAAAEEAQTVVSVLTEILESLK